jgi:hypothetical protein
MENTLEKELEQFTGTEQYFAYLGGLKLIDGAKYLATKAGCFWLMDIIASYQGKLRLIEFQLWELEVNTTPKGRSAVVTCREDTGKPALVKQRIPYTNFPLNSIKLYCQNGVILLPSEY